MKTLLLRSLFATAVLSVFVLCSPTLVAGQAAGAEIHGIIYGPDGARLPGVSVSIRHLETGSVVRIVTGSEGVYRASNLKPGACEISAELQGFEPQTTPGIELGAGEPRRVDLTMDIATVREIITVVGSLPRDALEATRVHESSARDVGEALEEVNGITKIRKGGIANDLVLRGFQGKDLNVLIDGERIYGACPNQMDPAAFHVDFAEVDRVEVGKGPFDMKNQGSLGEVVNIVTRQPLQGFHAGANFSGGSFGYVNPSATASYGGTGFSVLGGYSYRRSDPYTDGSGKRFTEYGNYRPALFDSDAFRVGTAWGRISGSPSQNQQVQFSFARQEADHVLYPYLQMDAIYDNGDRLNLDYQITGLSGPVRSVRVRAYYTDVRHWMTDEFRTSSSTVPSAYSMGTDAFTQTYGGKLETSLGDLALGVEGFSRRWDATTRMAGMGYQPQYSIPDVQMTSVGLYGEYLRKLSDTLRLSLGARIDRTRSEADPSKANTNLYYAYNSTTRTAGTDVYPSGSARLSYRASDAFELSGGFGHTVRVADPREHFFALKRAGSDWVGNPELVPSRNTGTDLAATFRHRGLLVESSGYFNWVADFVTVYDQRKTNPVAGIMNSSARSYANVDARIYGTEVRLAYSVVRHVFLSGDMSLVRGTQDAIPAKEIYSTSLAEIPPLSSRLGLRYDRGFLSGEIEGEFAGAQTRVNTDLLEQTTPGYGVANLKFGATWRSVAFRVGIDNVFGRNFYQHLSYQRDPFRSGVRVREPGRNLYFNAAYRF